MMRGEEVAVTDLTKTRQPQHWAQGDFFNHAKIPRSEHSAARETAGRPTLNVTPMARKI